MLEDQANLQQEAMVELEDQVVVEQELIIK